MRERGGRTLPFVVRSEDEACAVIAKRVLPGSSPRFSTRPERQKLLTIAAPLPGAA